MDHSLLNYGPFLAAVRAGRGVSSSTLGHAFFASPLNVPLISIYGRGNNFVEDLIERLQNLLM